MVHQRSSTPQSDQLKIRPCPIEFSLGHSTSHDWRITFYILYDQVGFINHSIKSGIQTGNQTIVCKEREFIQLLHHGIVTTGATTCIGIIREAVFHIKPIGIYITPGNKHRSHGSLSLCISSIVILGTSQTTVFLYIQAVFTASACQGKQGCKKYIYIMCCFHCLIPLSLKVRILY